MDVQFSQGLDYGKSGTYRLASKKENKFAGGKNIAPDIAALESLRKILDNKNVDKNKIQNFTSLMSNSSQLRSMNMQILSQAFKYYDTIPANKLKEYKLDKENFSYSRIKNYIDAVLPDRESYEGVSRSEKYTEEELEIIRLRLSATFFRYIKSILRVKYTLDKEISVANGMDFYPDPEGEDPIDLNAVDNVAVFLEKNIYDNETSFTYKIAAKRGTLTKFVIIKPQKDGDNDEDCFHGHYFQSLVDFIIQAVSNDMTVEEIKIYLNTDNNFVSNEDIAMIFHSLNMSNYLDEDGYLLDLSEQDEHDIVAYFNYINSELTKTEKQDNEDSEDFEEEKYEQNFSNYNILNNYYNGWNKNIEEEGDKELSKLEDIIFIQQELKRVDDQEYTEEQDCKFSKIKILTTVMAYSPKMEGKEVNPYFGLKIFDMAVPTKYCPYICYNDENNKSHPKVFIGEKSEDRPNYSDTIINSAETSKPDTIYIRLWLGDLVNKNAKMNESNQDSFFTVEWSLDKNEFALPSPVTSDECEEDDECDAEDFVQKSKRKALERVIQTFPFLNFSHGKEKRISGEFDIYNFQYEESTFLDIILNRKIINNYFYSAENKQPLAFKKRLEIKYFPLLSEEKRRKHTKWRKEYKKSYDVSFNITSRTTITDDIYEIYDPKTDTYSKQNISKNVPYIHIAVGEANNRQTLKDFIYLFKLALLYYNRNKDSLKLVYEDIIPELRLLPNLLAKNSIKIDKKIESITDITKRGDGKIKREAKLKFLKQRAPEVIKKGYPRSCLCNVQPIIIDDEDYEIWRNKKFDSKGTPRQILEFPNTGEKKFNFVCPNDEDPHPGVKPNKNYGKKGELPYSVCCYKSSHMELTNTSYSNYLKGIPPSKEGAKAESKISTNKILRPERIGSLPASVEELLSNYEGHFGELIRYGTIYSTNSLLHCLCIAIDDTKYANFETYEEKEEYVIKIRKYLVKVTNPYLMKQEMYDYTEEEIMNSMADNKVFLDPSSYYRAIEEAFGINIYAFSPPELGALGEETGIMAVPRHKIFHSRNIRTDRPTMVVIRTWGSESDRLEYPKCELICDFNPKDRLITKLFGEDMTKICHKTLMNVVKTITFELNMITERVPYGNLYYKLNINSIVNLKPYSQFIDNYGKMRAINFYNDGELMTVVVYPCQPENLPHDENIYSIDYQKCFDIFGNNVKAASYKGDLINGFWYPIFGLDYGIYIPVNPFYSEEEYFPGQPNPIISNEKTVTGRMGKMRRDLNIVIQIIEYIYEVTKLHGRLDIQQFAELYFTIDDFEGDSAFYYDFSKIGHVLPKFLKKGKKIPILDIIGQISTLAPTFIKNKKIVLYNADFADKIITTLNKYIKFKITESAEPRRVIQGFYQKESDYIQHPHSRVFVDLNALNSWLNSLSTTNDYERFYTIKEQVSTKFADNREPYLFINEEGKVYLIQGVQGGHLRKALAVSLAYIEAGFNIGYYVEDPDRLLAHKIYAINNNNSLVLVKDNSRGAYRYGELLYYGSVKEYSLRKNRRYAAMLDLLQDMGNEEEE